MVETEMSNIYKREIADPRAHGMIVVLWATLEHLKSTEILRMGYRVTVHINRVRTD